MPLEHIRGLVVAQQGRCAISGLPLDPRDVNADHINPLSRKELSPSRGIANVWLVHKKINAMKGSLTYDELVAFAKLLVEHEATSRRYLAEIQAGGIEKIPKAAFDKWLTDNCDENGRIKDGK